MKQEYSTPTVEQVALLDNDVVNSSWNLPEIGW